VQRHSFLSVVSEQFVLTFSVCALFPGNNAVFMNVFIHPQGTKLL